MASTGFLNSRTKSSENYYRVIFRFYGASETSRIGIFAENTLEAINIIIAKRTYGRIERIDEIIGADFINAKGLTTGDILNDENK